MSEATLPSNGSLPEIESLKISEFKDENHKQNGGDAAESEDEDDEGDNKAVNGEGAAKKKKKKKKKKKTGAAGGDGQTNPPSSVKQTDPPRVGLTKFFGNTFPKGEECPYVLENSYRTTSEELRHKERIMMEENPPFHYLNYNSIRRAGEVHRQVRQYAQKNIKPGMTMTQIANLIEDTSRALVEENGMEAGIGFPTGLSLNHVAAHYTPNPGDTIVLKQEDVLKVDIGVQVGGRICDSAFTMNFQPDYDKLLEAVKAATNAGVKEAGIDVPVSQIGAVVQEVMESYEVELGSQTLPVKVIRNLCGHSIEPYSIHGKKTVPICKSGGGGERMEEGEVFAIETFGSTGDGWIREEGECSHFSKIPDAGHRPIRLQSAKNLLNVINKNFGSLPFCRRYLDRIGEDKKVALEKLVEAGIVRDYPPLVDKKGCQTAQFEHTFILRPTCKEVISRGDDY